MNKLYKKGAVIGILTSTIASGGVAISGSAQALSLPSSTYHMDGTTVTIKGDMTTATPVVRHIGEDFKREYDCNKDLMGLTDLVKKHNSHIVWKTHDNCVYNAPTKTWNYGQVNYSYAKRTDGTVYKYGLHDAVVTITTKTKYINPNGTFMSNEQINAMQKTYNFFKIFRFLV